MDQMSLLSDYYDPSAQVGHDPDTDVTNLPLNPANGKPIPPMLQPGYYPGYSTLEQQAFWDEATRTVVLKRVNSVPPIRFFSEQELPEMEAIANRLIPQDDRDPSRRIPIVPLIDKELTEQTIDGYRFEDLPPEDQLYRIFLKGIDAIAVQQYQKSFVNCTHREQDEILKTIHDNKPPAGDEYWKQLGGDLRHVWVKVLSDVVKAYYAHPWAWDEIGFGGPAYPRGYMRLHNGDPEPWEKPEVRYEWMAPQDSISDVYQPIGLEPNEAAQFHGQMGQSGTH